MPKLLFSFFATEFRCFSLVFVYFAGFYSVIRNFSLNILNIWIVLDEEWWMRTIILLSGHRNLLISYHAKSVISSLQDIFHSKDINRKSTLTCWKTFWKFSRHWVERRSINIWVLSGISKMELNAYDKRSCPA